MKPHLSFAVENKLSEDADAPQLKVDLHFKSMDDFEPENVARQVKPLKETAGSAHAAVRSARQSAGQRQARRTAARRGRQYREARQAEERNWAEGGRVQWLIQQALQAPALQPQ